MIQAYNDGSERGTGAGLRVLPFRKMEIILWLEKHAETDYNRNKRGAP